MRVLGVDFGQKRLGLALSDASASLARPWQTVPAAGTPRASAEALATLIQQAEADSDDEAGRLAAIVVGLPRRLDGRETGTSQAARDFAGALAVLTGLDVHLQDERLSSREAESLLAVREKDWRRRKEQIDAVAAALILQDYLDRV